VTTISSDIKVTHRRIPPPPIEAWQYRGQPYEEFPDWVRSWIEAVYVGGPRPKPKKFHYALRDDEGYFWKWMNPERFGNEYEPISRT